MAPIHTIHGPINVPPQQRTAKQRFCPGMRSPWNLNFATFNPMNRDRADTIRRTCMLIALGCHTALDAVPLVLSFASFPIGPIIQLLITLICFFFLAGCLATIGNAEGERLVLGRMIGRWHFDVFLMFCAFVYGALFLSFFLGFLFGLHLFGGMLLSFLPLPMWVMLWVVAWVATWDTTPTPLTLA